MTHYEALPSSVEADLRRKQWEREEEARRIEREYLLQQYNSVKNLSHDRLPKEQLESEAREMINRVNRISEAIPTLNSLSLDDSLKRSWEIGIYRSDKDGNLTRNGEIFMVTMGRRNEAIKISLIRSEPGIDYHLLFWPDSEDYGNPHNNAIALKLVNERFDDLINPLEQSLGIVGK